MISNFNFNDKIVYLAPKNNITMLLEAKLQKSNIHIAGYIDNFKTDYDVLVLDKIIYYDYIIVYSPRFYQEVVKKFDKSRTIILYDFKNMYFVYAPNIITIHIPFIYTKLISLYNKIVVMKFDLIMLIFKKFNLTLDFNTKNIKKLKSINKRVFVIGNGPSLKIEDLNKLKNEITFASNKIFLAFGETDWRPTYYTIEDSLDLEEYYTNIKTYQLGIKFFPFNPDTKLMYDSIYYKQLKSTSYKQWKPSINLVKGLYGGESVAMTMIQFALALQANEIYLIGFDHNYKESSSQKNKLYKNSENEINHFHKDYRQLGDIWTEPRVENITFQFNILKNFCDSNNIKVFNATKGGKLEVFERVNLNDII